MAATDSVKGRGGRYARAVASRRGFSRYLPLSGVRSGVMVVVALITLLGLALRVYQLLRPGLLTGVLEYDDGVYFGSAVRLVHGVIPYRDFVLIQPPGITLLLSPVALASRAVGTDTGFAISRVLSACAGAASVWLCGLLVRHRGRAAVIIACGLVAIHPDSVGAAQSVLLEPWLVVFTLLGLCAAFSQGELVDSDRRLMWAGVALACAVAVKVWAIVPAAVLVVFVLAMRGRRAAISYVVGLVGGVAVTIGAFFVLAPRAFFEDVVISQLSRVDDSRTSMLFRLTSLFGFTDVTLAKQSVIVLAIVVVSGSAIALFAGWGLGVKPPRALDLLACVCLILTLAMFLWPVDYYDHYAAFFSPFLALVLAGAVGSLLSGLRAELLQTSTGPLALRAPPALSLALCVGLIIAAAIVRSHLAELGGLPAPTAQARQIPRGACVLTDFPAYTLTTNRFTSDEVNCPAMVDALGTDYALSHGKNGVTGAGRSAALVSVWLTALRHAQYVWLKCHPPGAPNCEDLTNRWIPWTSPAILRYFTANFRPAIAGPYVSYIVLS